MWHTPRPKNKCIPAPFVLSGMLMKCFFFLIIILQFWIHLKILILFSLTISQTFTDNLGIL